MLKGTGRCFTSHLGGFFSFHERCNYQSQCKREPATSKDFRLRNQNCVHKPLSSLNWTIPSQIFCFVLPGNKHKWVGAHESDNKNVISFQNTETASLKRKEIKISSSEWHDLKWEILLFSPDRLVSMSEFQQPPTNSFLQNYCQDIINHVSCCQHSSLTPTQMMCSWIAISLCCSSVPWFCIFYPFQSICVVLQHLAWGFILRV